MIPPHRPAFGIARVMLSSLPSRESKGVRQLEEAYAEVAGCEYAVWLPSARAGICWSLRAAIGDQAGVVAPAFTCSAVHEAIVRSGVRPHLIDAGSNDFLMDEQALYASLCGNHALVLSEAYGHTYDLAQIGRAARSAATVRVVDMAMAVPQ